MLDLWYAPTPNGWKVSIMLEECELPHRLRLVSLTDGEQHRPEFLALNPNNKIPVLVDHAPAGNGESPLSIFESGAILWYLAEKSGKFLPQSPQMRYTVMSWLRWQMSALGPMLGQNGHFLFYADQEVPYAIARFRQEAERLYGVLDARLAATAAFVAGDVCTIADFACFPWIMTHKAQRVALEAYPHVAAWFARMRARPALQRGLAVGRGHGPLGAERSRRVHGE
jgi:GST-like protein